MTGTPPTRGAHPERRALEAFLDGGLPRGEERRVEGHLARGCLRCLLAARELLPAGADGVRGRLSWESWAGVAGGGDGFLESFVARARRRALVVAAEDEAAPRLVAELLGRPPALRREAVRGRRRFQLLGLCEGLRQESRRQGPRDAACALELAELAVEVAARLDPAFYGPWLVADARALAWAAAGAALRAGGDLRGAQRALDAALELLEQGTGEPAEAAEVLSVAASLAGRW